MAGLAHRGELVLCQSRFEAVTRGLHLRQYGLPLGKNTEALKNAARKFEENPEGEESWDRLLQRLHDCLQRDHRLRLVVLDWERNDTPFYVILYKVRQEFHLLVKPEKTASHRSTPGLVQELLFFSLPTQNCTCVRGTPTPPATVPSVGTQA